MAYKKVEGYSDQKGSKYWGTGRIQKMIKEKDLKNERGALTLMSHIPPTVTSVLDLGCGIGRRHVHFPGLRYVGVDREEIMIENAKKIFPDLEFYLSDLMQLTETLPNLKKSFDMAFTFHVVQYNHPIQQQIIFNNIYEMIKPGGYYYMKENDNDCPRESVPPCFKEVARGDHGHTIFKV